MVDSPIMNTIKPEFAQDQRSQFMIRYLGFFWTITQKKTTNLICSHTSVLIYYINPRDRKVRHIYRFNWNCICAI